MWQQVGPIDDRDDVGGDAQAGTAYGLRYTNPALPGAVVDLHFYVAFSDARALKPKVSSPPYVVRREITYTLAGDVARPGETEWWSDSVDSQVDGPYGALDLAEDAARHLARRFRPSQLAWDGRPFAAARTPQPR
jgi:hypothetical protein